MNLEKLFEIQKKLDEHIVKEKRLGGRYLLPDKLLALIVELGELANEWRGFKFWSEDQTPRDYCSLCQMPGIKHECKNPLLEEYVDCLHFFLSIGLELKATYNKIDNLVPESNITDLFLTVFDSIKEIDLSESSDDYNRALNRFLELGERLGFSWDQIVQAYLQKNKTNHERQENGY